jgi:hypothetical protein
MGETVKVTFDIDRALYESFRGIAKGEGRNMRWYLEGAIREIVGKRMGEVHPAVPAAVREKGGRKRRAVAKRLRK